MYDYTNITAQTIQEAHRRAVYNVWHFGKEIYDQRGDLTMELTDINIKIPSSDISHVDNSLIKKLDNDFAEALINPDKAEQKGKDFIYAYGERLWSLNQLPKIVDLLKKEPNTRRAVIPIYDKIDNCITVSEVPCWSFSQWLLRDGKLNNIVYFRSNDVWGAFPSDAYGIRTLQKWIADQLRVDVGYYSHKAGPLHIRKTDENAVKAFLKV